MSGEIGVNDLLLARGVGGYDYGYGSNVLVADGVANGTATKEAIDCNACRISDSMDRISDQAEEGRRSAQFTTLVDKANSDTVRISDQLSVKAIQDAINDGNERVENVRTLADMRADSAQCCCDTQKLVMEEGCETRELINARALDDTQRDLDQALAKGTSLDTVAALAGAMQNQTASLIAALGNHHPHC